MENSFHSVRLLEEECKGCTNCIKHCPTEAIRVYQGKARIINELCIDCGECIRVCPNYAKQTIIDELKEIHEYPYTVALLAPSFFGQFPNATVNQVHQGVKDLGFNLVAQVGYGAEHVNFAIRQWMQENPLRPLISSACPTIVRLVQVRFDELVDHVIPLEAPVEITAGLVREQLAKEKGLSDKDVGVFFISPCPAKVSAIKIPIARGQSQITAAISMREVYGAIMSKLATIPKDVVLETDLLASALGMLWGRRGGEVYALEGTRVSVDGVYNVINILEDMAMGKLPEVDYLELQACPGGCVGGPLVTQNPFIAKARLEALCNGLPAAPKWDRDDLLYRYQKGDYFWKLPLQSKAVLSMDGDISTALSMIKQREIIEKELPGLDCGACGSPTCQCLAEDIARGMASNNDCIFHLRQAVQYVAADLWRLAKQVPPTIASQQVLNAMDEEDDNEDK